MKLFLVLVLFFFLTATVFAQQKVDLQINGVGSGTPYSTVIRKFGKPTRRKKVNVAADSSCSGEAETYLTLFYPGLVIDFLGGAEGTDLLVIKIEFTSKKWTASGIRIGTDLKNIKAKFGQPNETMEFSNNETYLFYRTKDDSGGVTFIFQNKKLVKIEMEEAIC